MSNDNKNNDDGGDDSTIYKDAKSYSSSTVTKIQLDGPYSRQIQQAQLASTTRNNDDVISPDKMKLHYQHMMHHPLALSNSPTASHKTTSTSTSKPQQQQRPHPENSVSPFSALNSGPVSAYPNAAAPPPPPPPPPPPAASVTASSATTVKVVPRAMAMKQATTKLDLEVDIFLTKRTAVTELFEQDKEQPGALPVLKPPTPPSIPTTSTPNGTSGNTDNDVTGGKKNNEQQQQQQQPSLSLIQDLVRRRAWIDVQKYTLELFTKSNSSYEPYYSALLHKTPLPSAETSSPAASSSTEREFIHIVQLRLQSMIKLRRYDELQREVIRLGLSQPQSSQHQSSFKQKTKDATSNSEQQQQQQQQEQKQQQHFQPPLELVLDAIACMQYYTNTTTTTGDNSISANHIQHTNSYKCIDALQEFHSTHFQDMEDEELEEGKEAVKDNTMNATHNFARRRLKCKCLMLQSNLFAKEGEFRSALLCLETILKDCQKHQSEDKNYDCCWKDQIEVYSCQGRILLQSGALPPAAIVFERARDLLLCHQKEEEGTTSTASNRSSNGGGGSRRKNLDTQRGQVQILINEGLLYFAHMDYSLAEGRFREALRLQRAFFWDSDPSILAFEGKLSENQESTTLLELEEDLTTPALNNMALCVFYTCQMRQTVELMEALVREDPTRYMTECLIFNLCTLYELGCDVPISDRKKRVLQLVAKRFALHDIGNECFRVS